MVGVCRELQFQGDLTKTEAALWHHPFSLGPIHAAASEGPAAETMRGGLTQGQCSPLKALKRCEIATGWLKDMIIVHAFLHSFEIHLALFPS